MEMSESNEELVKRIATLERELAELKAQLAKPEKPFVPMPMPKYDPTEGMSMPMSAMKPMVDLINPKDVKFDPNAWARNRYPQPGGFGSPVGPSGAREPEVKRGSGLVDPAPLSQPPGIKYIDQQIDVQDAIDKAELKRRLGVK
jgi:hypothetical protein